VISWSHHKSNSSFIQAPLHPLSQEKEQETKLV